MDIPILVPKIKDIIEILIISFVIYQLLLLIRGTRAVQILQGVGVLLLSQWICSLFALRTLHWILSSTLVMIFVAIPIVFQPELRRALGQIGKGGILSIFSTSREEEFACAVGEIVDGCFHMARKKMGAIIVIEREIGLEEFMETGTQVQAIITSRLLQSIFFANSPLHDGAVIIKDNKIDSAGCYLPLTENLEIDKDLGTRHRAAIGITEHTDCVALVVSEETGRVSVSINGRLKYDVSMKSLDRHLKALCNPRRKVEKIFTFPSTIKKSLNLNLASKKKKPVVITSRDSGLLERAILKKYNTGPSEKDKSDRVDIHVSSGETLKSNEKKSILTSIDKEKAEGLPSR